MVEETARVAVETAKAVGAKVLVVEERVRTRVALAAKVAAVAAVAQAVMAAEAEAPPCAAPQ